MRRLSDREGNWCNRNCAQMSELRRKNEEATRTAAFERAIIEAASICRSYSRDGARATRATERFLEQGIRTSFPSPSKITASAEHSELPLTNSFLEEEKSSTGFGIRADNGRF